MVCITPCIHLIYKTCAHLSFFFPGKHFHIIEMKGILFFLYFLKIKKHFILTFNIAHCFMLCDIMMMTMMSFIVLYTLDYAIMQVKLCLNIEIFNDHKKKRYKNLCWRFFYIAIKLYAGYTFSFVCMFVLVLMCTIKKFVVRIKCLKMYSQYAHFFSFLYNFLNLQENKIFFIFILLKINQT